MFRLVNLLGLLVAVSARRSPNADYIEGLNPSPNGSRFSDDVVEDARLDVPTLITKYGYPAEVHEVVTSDGYILELHRIPHGRHGSPCKKPAVLIMHGLLSSSADFVIMGPGNALGYILADAGYDVWLGNARGTYYSRRHLTLNPDSILNKNFWRFSWDQIGNHDLPAIIDFIIQTTGQEKIHYIGHSQGGTAFLVLNSLRPEYNDKFISFQGLATACFFDNNDNSMFIAFSVFENVIENVVFALNAQEIFGNREFVSKYCVEGSIYNKICKSVTSRLYTREYYNSTMVPVILGHTPAGASIRQLVHYGQIIRFKQFRRYNYNLAINLKEYGSVTPPVYDLSLVTVPTYLYYGLSDVEVDYRDLLKLAETLPNVVRVNEAKRATFNHFDFIWAMDVKELMYDDILDSMRDADQRFL